MENCIKESILQNLQSKFNIYDKELLIILFMTKKEKIIDNHINNVCKVYPPTGDTGAKRYYMTKLTPKDKSNKHIIYGKTQEEIELKILSFYMNLEEENKSKTFIEILNLAYESSKKDTRNRALNHFYSNLKSLEFIKINKLNEDDISNALDKLIGLKIKEKEFNGAVSVLNKVNDYCHFNKIKCMDIRGFIKLYRKNKVSAKINFIPVERNSKKLAFNELESKEIVNYALENPNFKSLSIAFLICTGLRIGELLALKKTDIFFNERYMYICRKENVHTKEITEWCKDNSQRNVLLNNDARKILELIFALHNNININSEFLFLNEESRPSYKKLDYSAIQKYIKKLQERILKLDNKNIRSAHDCRRTYASVQYLKLGARGLSFIQSQLGHSTPLQTWDYIKDIVEMKDKMIILEEGNLT